MKLVDLERHEFGGGWWLLISRKISGLSEGSYLERSDGKTIHDAKDSIQLGIYYEDGKA